MAKRSQRPGITNGSRSDSSRLTITFRPTSELKLDPNNPKKHTARQIEQLAQSIALFGFNVPVLVAADAEVVAGHGRLLAARRLNLPEVPTICLEHLSEAQRPTEK